LHPFPELSERIELNLNQVISMERTI
jgi:hypothetical protein